MSEPVPFEHSLAELEIIVRQLEKGELSLDESLKQFEKGIGLARQCQVILNQAEQKIEVLTSNQDKTSLSEDSLGD